MTRPAISTCSDPRERARRLGFWGLDSQWDQWGQQPWVLPLLQCEEAQRHQRSLDRRIHSAALGSFTPFSQFDWSWPRKLDRPQVEEAFTLRFLPEGDNVLIVGPNGVGKTMLAKNLAYQALLQGHTVLFTTASAMLSDLGSRDTAWSRQQRLRRYVRPQLLCIDEVGYLSYDNRHADLLFEVITHRYERPATSTVVTTNKPFTQWNEVFPNAACVVTLIDRLTHRSEVIQIDADSFRLKEAKQRAAEKATRRRNARATKPAS